MNTLQRDTIDLLENNPVVIGRAIGFKDLTDLHNDWLKEWLYGYGDSTTQAHRGSFKTSDLSVFLALSLLVYRSKNIIFLRKTDSDVAEVIRTVSRIIKSGAFQKIAKTLYGITPIVLKETASEIHTNLYNGISGASQILGIGLGGSLTGKHADIVVTDDIVNIKDRVSRAERERTKLMYMELQNIKNRNGRIINTGTPWHKDDAFSLMPNIKKYTCYDTGLMTQEEIKHLRSSMSASLFSANYELKHIADENALFTDAQFTSDVDAIYNGICHIDASYGGEDSTAFTVIAEKGKNLIVYGRKYTKHVDACLDDIMRLKAKYRAGTTWTERNADKGYLDKTLKARGDISNTYHEKMNKHIKISTYLKENWGRVLFLDDTDPEYIAEILDYTEHAQHDDCPDSLASAIRQLGKKPMTLNRGVRHGL
jgi:hypothetical protein